MESAACESFSQDVLLGFDGNDFTMPVKELPESLRKANLYGADFTRVRDDARTRLEGALTTKMRDVPKWEDPA